MSEPLGEETLLEFLYACPVGLVECDAVGTITLMNPHAMQHLAPIAGERDIGNFFAAIEEHAPEIRNLVSAFSQPRGRICDNHRIAVDLAGGRRGAEPKVLACSLVKLGPNRLMATLSDISSQVAQERRLQQADAWFATLLDEVNDYSVVTVTPTGEILCADHAFTVQLGLVGIEPVGQLLATLMADTRQDGGMRLAEQFDRAGRDGWHLHEGWQVRAGGEKYWCQRLVVSRCREPGAPPFGFLVVLRDVPPKQGNSDDLQRLLTCDHLTGAANRMHFSQTLERERTRWQMLGQPLSLVVLDLDHFKSVNDTHGHPVGDGLLELVARSCRTILPRQGLFARLGGEEFAVLLPQADADAAARHAEAMRETIEALAVPVEGAVLRVTASLAYATLDEAEGSIDAMVALADRRLYEAKRAGRNRVHHPGVVTA